MGSLAIPDTRRKKFDVFFYTHVILLPLVLLFSCLHNSDMIVWFLLPVGLYLVDRVIRAYRSHQEVNTVEAEVYIYIYIYT